MNRLLWGLALFLTAMNHLHGQQEHLTIRGQLLDANNNEPLPFASIYLAETSIGTTTNMEGVFVFHVPLEFSKNSIVISMIGYRAVERSVSDFEESPSILLEEDVLELQEVVVTAEKALTAKQIVKKAYNSIGINYPSEPYILEGFMRDLQNEDSTYVELLECAIKMRYQPNRVKREPIIELVELRQSYIAEKHPWNDQWDRKNSIVDLIEDDFIRFDYGPIKGGNGWKYKVESVLPFGDKFVYKINAINKPFRSAQFFIDTESFAFVKIEYSKAARNGRFYKRRLSNGQQEKSYHLIFEYQEYKGKWYLKYQKEEDIWVIFKGLESKKILFSKYPKKELFINKIVIDDLDQYPFVNNLHRNKSIESQAKPYDATFWKYYNAPTQTKEGSKIEEYLRKARIK